MAGSIRRQSKDTWELTIDLGRDPTLGRRRRRYLTVRGAKREAERALAEALHQRDTGTDLTPARLTVADYLRRWLRDCAAPRVAPSAGPQPRRCGVASQASTARDASPVS
ncbi:MAG: hypothetical protein HYZ72_18450 [Deltaproteobacteria bacterium]|nr:hypothetical protein [Deltaproteobacteria bacterium]